MTQILPTSGVTLVKLMDVLCDGYERLAAVRQTKCPVYDQMRTDELLIMEAEGEVKNG